MTNHEIVVQGLKIHFFPLKARQLYKRYLLQGFFNPEGLKILNFVCQVNNIVEYLNHFPTFPTSQEFPRDKIIELFEFALTRKW